MVIARELMAPLGFMIEVLCSEMTDEDNIPISTARGLVEVNEDEAVELISGEESDVKPTDLLPQYLDESLVHCYLKLL